MSKAYEWREAIEKAKGLEQRFELSSGHTFTVAPAGVIVRRETGEMLERVHLEVDDAELVRLGSWLYETFYEEPTEPDRGL